MYAKIQPVQCYPSQATVLLIAGVSVSLGSSASFGWGLCPNDKLDSALAQGTLSLDGAAYAAWGEDDEYLYRYTAEQLGLTIIEIVPDAVAAAASPDVAAPDLPAVAPAVAPVVSDEVPAGGTND